MIEQVQHERTKKPKGISLCYVFEVTINSTVGVSLLKLTFKCHQNKEVFVLLLTYETRCCRGGLCPSLTQCSLSRLRKREDLSGRLHHREKEASVQGDVPEV